MLISPLHPFSVLIMVHSIFRRTSVCYTATKLYMGLRSPASGNCSHRNKLSKLTQPFFDLLLTQAASLV